MPRRRRRRLATGPDREQRAAVHIAGRAIVSARFMGRAAVRCARSRPGTSVEIAGDGRAVDDLELEELQTRATALLAGLAAALLAAPEFALSGDELRAAVTSILES